MSDYEIDTSPVGDGTMGAGGCCCVILLLPIVFILVIAGC